MNEDIRRLTVATAKAHEDWFGEPGSITPAGAEAIVRALLEAIREPSHAMLNRGGYHCITGAGAVSAGDMAQAKAVWKAMVKVMLDE